MAYEICKDCLDGEECYIWYSVEQLLKGECPFKAYDEKEGVGKLIRYELMHDGTIVHTLTTRNAATEEGMINFMLKLSDENLGMFTLWRVENDPETGREKPTLIGASRNGVEL